MRSKTVGNFASAIAIVVMAKKRITKSGMVSFFKINCSDSTRIGHLCEARQIVDDYLFIGERRQKKAFSKVQDLNELQTQSS